MSDQMTSKTLSTLLGRLSHDLKNPLAVVIANLRFLEGALMDPDLQEAAVESTFAAERMARVLEDLSQLGGWRDGSRHPSFGPVSLATLESPLRKAFEGQLGSRTLDVELPATAVRSDPGLLSRALINVVEHGLRRTISRGTVRVEGAVDAESEAFELRVLDEGPPFDPTQQPSFVCRELPGAQTPGQGYRSDQGLGLLFAGIAVRALGGVPSVEARPAGAGVSFRMRFGDVA